MSVNSTEPAQSETPRTLADGPPPAVRKVEGLLGEYLHSWGLRDPASVAAVCRRWASQAQGKTQSELARAALQLAEHDVDKWLDHLTALVAPDSPDDAMRRRGLLAMALQASIDDYPDAFLRYDDIPEGLVRRLQDAARPVVPGGSVRAAMQVQPLGELPPLLRPSLWRRMLNRVVAACLLVTRSPQDDH